MLDREDSTCIKGVIVGFRHSSDGHRQGAKWDIPCMSTEPHPQTRVPDVSRGALINRLTTRETLNNPDWARFPKPRQTLNGFTRSILYDLASRGLIVTRSLKRRDQQRGIRFVFIPSLTALLEKAPS